MKQTRSLSEFSRLSEYTRLYPISVYSPSYFSHITCVVGSRKDRPIDTILLNTQSSFFKIGGKENIQKIYVQELFLPCPMIPYGNIF